MMYDFTSHFEQSNYWDEYFNEYYQVLTIILKANFIRNI